jgi:hypothetical protein
MNKDIELELDLILAPRKRLLFIDGRAYRIPPIT